MDTKIFLLSFQSINNMSLVGYEYFDKKKADYENKLAELKLERQTQHDDKNELMIIILEEIHTVQQGILQ